MTRLLQRFRRALLSEYGAVFCLSLCLLFGLTFQEWLAFDVQQSVDAKTYWGLAHFDFEQSVVRKYRVIIPFLVRGLFWLVSSLGQWIKPGSLSGDFTLKTCFYVVNMLSSAAWCTLAYAYLRALRCGRAASVLAVMMIVTSFWTLYNTSAFMTDSFYCCFVALTLLGIEKRNTRMLFWSVLIAPFAKEAYIFMLPVIFLYSHVPRVRQLGWFALSGLLVFSYRYLYDHLTHHVMSESLGLDLLHFTYISNILPRFSDPGYTVPLAATIGLWFLVPLAGCWLLPGFAACFRQQARPYMLLWFLLVVVQMLVSGDLSRMFYLYLPVYAFFVALTVNYWRRHYLPPAA